MGQEETRLVLRVRTHVIGSNASLNNLDIRLHIPTNKSEYSLNERCKTRLCDGPGIDTIAIALLSLSALGNFAR